MVRYRITDSQQISIYEVTVLPSISRIPDSALKCRSFTNLLILRDTLATLANDSIAAAAKTASSLSYSASDQLPSRSNGGHPKIPEIVRRAAVCIDGDLASCESRGSRAMPT